MAEFERSLIHRWLDLAARCTGEGRDWVGCIEVETIEIRRLRSHGLPWRTVACRKSARETITMESLVGLSSREKQRFTNEAHRRLPFSLRPGVVRPVRIVYHQPVIAPGADIPAVVESVSVVVSTAGR